LLRRLNGATGQLAFEVIANLVRSLCNRLQASSMLFVSLCLQEIPPKIGRS
jgi:hypothetical protein